MFTPLVKLLKDKLYRCILLFLYVVTNLTSFGQSLDYLTVIDNYGYPIEGCTILVTSFSDTISQSITDANGKGYIVVQNNNITHNISINKLGFQSLSITTIGEKLHHVLTLQPINTYHLLPVTIAGTPSEGQIKLLGYDYKMMPASFQDPTRVLIRYPGISTDNDGANGIIFRGMPPQYVRWQLHGNDIVNPNHLSNAGTSADLGTINSGGVNAFNGNILKKFDFISNPSSIAANNVAGGIANLSMEKKINSYIDINLVGFEAGYNHQVGTKNFYTAYRYSFVGLLNALGVNFGNEKINYQDFAFHGNIINKDRVNLSVFGMLGSSSNFHAASDSLSQITTFKDMQDISYTNDLLIGGLQNKVHRPKYIATSTLTYSTFDTQRAESSNNFWKQNTGISNTINFSRKSAISSLTSSLDQNINPKTRLLSGIKANHHNEFFQLDSPSSSNLSYFYFYGYQQINRQNLFWKWLDGDIGTSIHFDTQIKKIKLDASSAIHLQWKRTKLDLKWRFANTIPDVETLLLKHTQKISHINGQHTELFVSFPFAKGSIQTNVFYHDFKHLPEREITIDGETIRLHTFNGNDGGMPFLFRNLSGSFHQNTKARSYGMGTHIHYTFNPIWTISCHATTFKSEFSSIKSDNVWQDARFNLAYTTGWSAVYTKPLNGNVFAVKGLSLILSGHLRGGERLLPIQLPNSEIVYQANSPFDNTLKQYSRWDFRIVYHYPSNSAKYRHRWSMDVQNLFNNNNDGFYYFDRLLNQTKLQPQLGLIPVLSYKIEFLK